MKAMILAAGRGERMRPLTDNIPKPLLPIAGKPLIAYHLIALANAGIRQVVINLAYLGQQIQNTLGDGHNYGVHIDYSFEPQVLETGGGIYQALPLLGSEPFIVLSADIWTDYPLQRLLQRLPHSFNGLAHLVMVDNPEFHPHGDFCLHNGLLYNDPLSVVNKTTGNITNGTTDNTTDKPSKLTFANIGIYRPELFQHCQAGVFPLINVLNPAIADGKISGEYYQGDWANLGTPRQWQQLAQRFETGEI